MILEIAHIGNPILREIAEEVGKEELASSEFQQFIDNLIETKRNAHGAGLAAPQVSVSKRVFVVEVVDNPRYPYKPNYPLTVVVNPKIELLTEVTFDSFEGCLSIPDLRGVVKRCPEVRVTGLDRNGEVLDLEVYGISAATFQHENDHLNGILVPDKVEDTHTLCTWNEFRTRYQDDFSKIVASIVEEYGS